MSMGRSDLVEIEGTLEHETDKAILVDFGGDEPVWIPKSQCEFSGQTDVVVTMKRSLAKEKDLL